MAQISTKLRRNHKPCELLFNSPAKFGFIFKPLMLLISIFEKNYN